MAFEESEIGSKGFRIVDRGSRLGRLGCTHMAIPILDNIARGLSGITQTVKTIHEVDVRIRINEAVNDLHSDITSLRLQISAITSEKEAKEEEVRALKAELVNRQRWDEESVRYRLHEAAPGIYVYAVKPECQGTEPPHYLCEKCFSKKIKSVIQRAMEGGSYYKCHTCPFEYRLLAPVAYESVPINRKDRSTV